MRFFSETAEGKFLLPTALSWELRRTGGVPCDTLAFTCRYAPETEPLLRDALRLTAEENGRLRFCGVLDEYEVSLGADGCVVSGSCRGMAARLLDTEAEAALFERATAEEIVARYVNKNGVASVMGEPLAGENYRVTAGSSAWRAVSGFAEKYGGFTPYFSADGVLHFEALRGGECLLHTDKLRSLRRCERRCEALSAVTLYDPGSGIRESVRGTLPYPGEFLRRIFYCTSAEERTRLREKAREEIARAFRETLELRAVFDGAQDAEIGDRARLSAKIAGTDGTFRVTEILRRLDADGEKTELLLQRE